MIPGLRRVALLGDQGVSEALIKASEAQAQSMGLQTLRLRVAAPNPDLEGAFTAFRQEQAGGFVGAAWACAGGDSRAPEGD